MKDALGAQQYNCFAIKLAQKTLGNIAKRFDVKIWQKFIGQ